MKIELHEISIRELAKGYRNTLDEGVVGYGGRLDIRPKYQREFVYKDKQRDAVIDTVRKGFPLNVMYWVKNEGGGFEVLDGQQRTISIGDYINGAYSINGLYYHNLPNDKQELILNYKLMIYICEGTDSEKLDWFRIINIAGEKLTDQELRNAVYSGTWLSEAKRYFSKPNCPAYGFAGDYLTGTAIHQDYLETALRWISGGNIEGYMAKHQHDPNANEIWLYFQAVINWVKAVFPNYRKEMKSVEWGLLYNQFKDKSFDQSALEQKIAQLMQDEDVTSKKGIYSYVLNGDERHLNIRSFSDNMKREAYERQGGICPACGESFDIGQMEGDHIKPWHSGGKTLAENCQMLCKDCNRKKSGK